MNAETKEIIVRAVTSFMRRKLGDEFDYAVVVGKKGENAPLVIHSLEDDDALVIALSTVIDAMMGLTDEPKAKGSA